MEYGKACSFTGYRNSKLYESLNETGHSIDDIRAALKKVLKEKIDEGFAVFQCGMALGADTMFAEEVINLRESNLLLQLVAVVPCLNQEKHWSYADKERYYQLLNLADKVVYTAQEYYDGCMHVRNRYLVDNCDELVAIFDGKKGGSAFTVQYAESKKKKITVIEPSRLIKVVLYN